jgi:phthalate 4,5-dioxygenase oxygenase subunit
VEFLHAPADNELLCRVEGEAAMGQMMRRHWLPVCMAEEVAEPDGAPVKARLLGVDLVVFRDTKGRVGVMDERCPHRGASLVFGRNEDCGLRCLYHGWKFGVDGAVQDMASEPADSRLRANLKHRAYAVREAGGFIWAWLGLRTRSPSSRRRLVAGRDDQDQHREDACGLQLGAGARGLHRLRPLLEPAFHQHAHRRSRGVHRHRDSLAAPVGRQGAAPRGQATDFGFHYAAIRRPIRDPETQDYVRTTLFIAPVHRPDPAQRPVQSRADAGPDR